MTVALNGVDFNDDYSTTEFTFNGTGGSINTWVYIVGTMIMGLLIVSILIFLSAIREWMKSNREVPNYSAYTGTGVGGGHQVRGP